MSQTDSIKVIVNGAHGRMGSEAVAAVHEDSQLECVAELDHEDNLAQAIKDTQADVVVDFTTPNTVFENVKTIIQAGASPVVGTTGLSEAQIQELQKLSASKKLGGVIAPNFSIGALLMMEFSKQAVKYLPDVEIIELHHDGKKDAPSGTAVKTAELIAEHRDKSTTKPHCEELIPGALGAKHKDIPIHSVRLPGFVAHQQVIFGGTGETLTLKHDSIDRKCFMPGVVWSCKKVVELDRLVYGLGEIMFSE